MKKSLYIAVPAYDGNMKTRFAIALMRFLSQTPPEILTGSPYLKLVEGESHIDRARNRIAKMFLDSDRSHLLMLDSDILFEAHDLELLLSHDEDVVCGLYPKKTRRLEWVINALEKHPKPGEDGLLEIAYGGTGCMLISRRVLEQMIERRPAIQYTDDSQAKMGIMWNFFGSGVYKDRWLSEDWAFCHEWREMGGKIFADARVQLKHVGGIDFPLAGTFRTWEEVEGWFDFQSLYDVLSTRLEDGDRCAEIGCWQGRSTLYLAEKIRESGVAAKIVAVDTWKGDPKDEAQMKFVRDNGGDIFHIFDRNRRASGNQHIILPSQGDSVGVALDYMRSEKPPLKWVFIDGDHSYEAVKADIAAWARCVEPDGIMAGHDIGYTDVRLAVEESFTVYKSEGTCWYAERRNYAEPTK